MYSYDSSMQNFNAPVTPYQPGSSVKRTIPTENSPLFSSQYSSKKQATDSFTYTDTSDDSPLDKTDSAHQPDELLTRFSQLNPKNVKKLGTIKGMLFDVDDTLSKFQLSGQRTIPPELIKQLKALNDSGIKLGIVSNNPSSKTATDFQKMLRDDYGIKMDVVTHADKPGTEGLKMLADDFGIPTNQMVMVGDQGTDVESGKKAGFKTIQVDWFGESSTHKKIMHLGDEAILHLDKFKSFFGATPKPNFFSASTEQPTAIAAQAG